MLLRSQSYSHSDTSLWDSPLSPQQVLRNGIKKVIIKRVGWCRPECSRPRYATLTTSYSYDNYGYPIFLSVESCREHSDYVSENIYNDGILVKSVLNSQGYSHRVFERIFTSANHADSCTWLMNGEEDCATTYVYDSVLRMSKTNYYNLFTGQGLSLKNEIEDFYNANNLPDSSMYTYHYGAEWMKEIETISYNYKRNVRVHKIITRSKNQKIIKVEKIYYRGTHKKKTKVIYKNPDYHLASRIQKISRSHGLITYRDYSFSWIYGFIPYRRISERRIYHASSGLIIRNIYSKRRLRDILNGGSSKWLTEYSYVK